MEYKTLYFVTRPARWLGAAWMHTHQALVPPRHPRVYIYTRIVFLGMERRWKADIGVCFRQHGVG